MYQYIFDQDTTSKVKDSTSNSKTIFEKFGEVDNKYNNLTSRGQDLTLEKMKYTKPSEQDVETDAKNSLESYKNSSINSINQNFEEKNKNIDESIEEAKQSSQKEKNDIVLAYNSAKSEAKDDAIKRGLARSSIIVNTLASYDKEMLNSLNAEANNLNQALTKYQNEKNLLEEQKQSALSAFDIEYAVKLQDKINQINDSIYEKEKEVIEYNNKIAETEAKWKQNQEDAVYDKTVEIADLMAKHGISVFDVLKQNEKYELAKTHLSSMNKEDALLEFTNNSNYISHLGKSLYNKLLNELKSN